MFTYIIVPSGIITSVDLQFNPMTGVLGNATTAVCHAQLTVNATGCTLQFHYGFVTKEAAGGAGLDVYNFAILSPVSISSAGETLVQCLSLTRIFVEEISWQRLVHLLH